MSNMLSTIVTAALARVPDIAVVGYPAHDQDLTAQIRLTGADAVIVQTRHPGALPNFLELLEAFPALKVVAIDLEGQRGALHQLRPYSIRYPEMSVDVLLAA